MRPGAHGQMCVWGIRNKFSMSVSACWVMYSSNCKIGILVLVIFVTLRIHDTLSRAALSYGYSHRNMLNHLISCFEPGKQQSFDTSINATMVAFHISL